jgi:hypothetical protein
MIAPPNKPNRGSTLCVADHRVHRPAEQRSQTASHRTNLIWSGAFRVLLFNRDRGIEGIEGIEGRIDLMKALAAPMVGTISHDR